MTSEQLGQALAMYEGQLAELRQQLGQAGEQERLAELRSLEDDLGELIRLTSAQLLEARKAEILGLLGQEEEEEQQQQQQEEEEEQQEKEEANESEEASEDEAVRQCSVVRRLPDGLRVRQNAVVHELEAGESDERLARVFLCNPTCESERPCDFFLENRCRFSDAECRRSHGLLVDADSLGEYRPPDYSLLSREVPVLCRTEADGLWLRASLLHSNYETGECELAVAGESLTLPFASVLPLCAAHDSERSDSAESDKEDWDAQEDSILLWQPQQPSGRLGDWERHTRGIGSKLLQSMGYKIGEGLGRRGRQGLAQPLPIVRAPPGRSLDTVMALRRRAGGEVDIFERRAKRRRREGEGEEKATANTGGVFDLLNCGRLSGAGQRQSQDERQQRQQSHRLIRSQSDLELNRSLFSVQEDVRRCSADVRRLSAAVERHSAQRDGAAFAEFSRRLSAAERRLDDLRQRERTLATHKASRSDRRKLTAF